MKRIEITAKSRRELHDQFEQTLPPPYGRTLDALHDILSTYAEPLELILPSNVLYEALGDQYGDNFFRMLKNTAVENPKLKLIIE